MKIVDNLSDNLRYYRKKYNLWEHSKINVNIF